MDVVTLSRLQFAFTIGYHFIFVPMSIGIGMIVVASERRYYRSGLPTDKVASAFWIKLFTTTFAMGVATGLTMEFAFGANWADYSRFVGDVFGAPLAAEGLLAFFLESTFLGVLLFGRQRVSKGLYYLSTWLVFLGSILSAVWILIANSWMQTPQGYRIEDGRAVLTDFWAAALNPSFAPRFFHTVAATLITGSFVVAGICAWYYLKRRHLHLARHAMMWALSVGLLVSLAMPLLGHWGALVVAEHQPIKMAAFENVTVTRNGAPLWLFGWLTKNDDATYDTHGIAIPNGLSLILHLDPNARVTGLDAAPPQDRPPEPIVFQSYHLMIALGVLFVLVFAAALFLLWSRRLETARWMLWLLMACIPLALLATNMGWTSAEVGRQPWIVQGLMRTSDGVSPAVSSGEVWATLGMFGLVYLVLFIAWLRIFLGIVRKGPQDVAAMPEAEKTASVTPSGAGR